MIYKYDFEIEFNQYKNVKMDVYEFNKSKGFYSYLCQELHLALVYHDSEKFSKVLNDLGLFTPTSIFRELVVFGAPQEIIKKVFDHKKGNDAFIEDIQSVIDNQEVSLNELNYILEDYWNLSPYDIVNVQMLLNGSFESVRSPDAFHIYYSKSNIWANYKPLHAFVDELVELTSYCGEYILLCILLEEFEQHGISFKFDPLNNSYHKNIMNILNRGIAGNLLYDEGCIGSCGNSIVYEYIKQKLLEM